MTTSPGVSVVVPVRNEAGNVEPLITEIERALTPEGPFEIIYVNDGSTDNTGAELARLAATRPHLREIRHQEIPVRPPLRGEHVDRDGS